MAHPAFAEDAVPCDPVDGLRVGFLGGGLEDQALAGAPSGGCPSAGGSARGIRSCRNACRDRGAVGVALHLPRSAPFVTTCGNRMEGCSAALAPSPPVDDLLQMLHSNLWSAMMRAAN